jgi:tRNA(fMet)-specific endonuclease VapC
LGIGTSREYGRIKHLLLKKGKPIPENDIWVAAHAIEYDLTLVTRDEHFKNIDDLKRTVW